MKDSLIAALGTMLTLQRWNLHPRVEKWVEAENAAMVTHLAYGISRAQSMAPELITHLLIRTLFKSLNKHYMTDISLFVRDKMRIKDQVAWTKLVDSNAKKTSKLFPRRIDSFLHGYLTDAGTYNTSDTQLTSGNLQRIEELTKFCQIQVALQECEINHKVYSSDYEDKIRDLQERRDHINGHSDYDRIISRYPRYFQTIGRLKYLRRWNQINRIVSSSVLGHTHIVSILAVVFSKLSEDELDLDTDFLHKAILRALFHDVPECMTGDIVTPVKNEIEKYSRDLLTDIEQELTQEFINGAPNGVREDINTYNLLKELSTDELESVDSLVKDCDRLALIIECLCEKTAGVETPDIKNAYFGYYQELSKSEWPAIREYLSVIADHWYDSQSAS